MEGHSFETDPRISVPIHRIEYLNVINGTKIKSTNSTNTINSCTYAEIKLLLLLLLLQKCHRNCHKFFETYEIPRLTYQTVP